MTDAAPVPRWDAWATGCLALLALASELAFYYAGALLSMGDWPNRAGLYVLAYGPPIMLALGIVGGGIALGFQRRGLLYPALGIVAALAVFLAGFVVLRN